MQVRICPASLPPPMASNASVAPVSTSALVRSSMKVGAVESTICFAPILRRMSACSALRTILTRPMPSLRQILLSIWPRLDAAAVCTSALWPSRRMVSVMPSAVSGLTKHEAPSAGVTPAGSGRHSLTFRQRYCAYMAPPIMATVLPISAFAASDEPVLITTPAPSLPTGIDSSSRPAIAFIAASGTFAVTTGASLVPEAFADVMSAAPTSSPRSEGLIGEASTRTTISSSAGSGVGTLASDISSSPLFLISERSCSPVLPSALILNPPGLCFSRFDCTTVSRQRFQRRLARIFRLAAQLLLDAQQLVIFGGAVGARQPSGLDQSAIGGDREVGDGGVLGLAGAVRHHGGVAGLIRHLDRAQRLRQRTDLVDFDQNRIGATVLDAVGQPRHICDEQIVADQLALFPDQIGQFLPAVHVVFRHAVFDRDDRITRGEIGEIFCLLRARAGLVLAAIDVSAVLEEFGGGAIQPQHDVGAGLVAGLADRGHDELERSIRRRQVWREAALVADIGVMAGLFQFSAQGVENLRAAAQRLGKRLGADRQDHEFLKIDRIVGMHAAIDDVHHRYRQGPRRGAADVAIQRHVEGFRRGLGTGQRHAEDGVGAEPALVGRAVEIDHDLVDLHLLLDRH